MCANQGWGAEGWEPSENKYHTKHKFTCRIQLESNGQKEIQNKLWQGGERARRQMRILND